MNYLAEKRINLAGLKQVCHQNQKWLWFCFFLWVLAQTFFWIYPPRGYIAEDMIVFASVRGQPLFSAEHLWQKVFNDDRLMLEVLEKSKIFKGAARISSLEYLNENIRRSLRFSSVNEVIFKVSFIQPGKGEIRPFLNLFVERFLHEASSLSDDELMRRRQRVTFQYQQLERRNILVHKLLGPITSLEEILPDEKGYRGDLNPAQETTMVGKIALLLINELNQALYAARVNLLNHTDLTQKILKLFPYSNLRLTDPETPARPVQPYLPVFYLFIFLAASLFCLAGLIYLSPNDSATSSTNDAVES